MKSLCSFIFLFGCRMALASLPGTTSELHFCLSSAYAAQKAMLIEEHYFTDRIERLNLDKNCEFLIKSIELQSNNHFVIFGENHTLKETWSINEKKEFRQNEYHDSSKKSHGY